MYYKLVNDEYILAVGDTPNGGVEITAEEYSEITTILSNRPQCESGYGMRLRTDLTWEYYELTIVDENSISTEDQEATIEDYQNALAELGVVL